MSETYSNPRREARQFFGLCALLWGFFFLLACFTPIMLDDWYQVAWHQRHELSPATLWEYAHYNYFNYNPRLGENFLLLVNGPRAIHLLLTPTIELLLLLVMFVMAFGHWPRATVRDARRLFFALVLLWLVTPVPGIMFFYRPFTTNYLFSFCFQLLLFVPYRLELARDRLTYRSLWLAPLLAVWGIAAGMTNEHTGPTAIVALAAVIFLLWYKHRQIRLWMLTGLASLCVGYPMLFFAPGQSLRYGGLATKSGALELVADRGPDGTFQIILDFMVQGQLGLDVIAAAALIAYVARRRQTAAAPAAAPAAEPTLRIERTHSSTVIALVLAAGSILVTLFASPVVGERMFFAPSVLFVCALLVIADVLTDEPAARRFLVRLCVIAFVWNGVRLMQIYPKAYAENGARLEAIAAAPPGGIAHVEPYSHFGRSSYILGDDFGYASLREYVAHEVYGKGGIEFTEPVRAEPTAPLTMTLEVETDPPLPPAEVLHHIELPLTYIPSYVDRMIQVVRRIDGQLKGLPGHRFVKAEAPVHGLDLPELRGRKLLGLRWDGRDLTFIDGRRLVDKRGLPYFLLWRGTVPPGLTDGYIRACGETLAVPMRPDPDGKGLRMTYVPRCRGTYLAIACTAKECWLAGTTWR